MSGIDGRPRFTGNLKSAVQWTGSPDAPLMDVRAEVEATTDAAKLSNLIAAFETAGTPQIITGSVGAAWGTRHRVRVDLTSRWLDLDHIADPGAKTVKGPNGSSDEERTAAAGPRRMPLAVARQLFAGLIDTLPTDADLDAKLTVDQVNLGGEPVSDLRILLSGKGGPLEMRSLSANMPGGARVDFSGRLNASTDGKAAFDGNVFVGGPSLVRMMKWATPDYDRLAGMSDGAFTLTAG